MGTETHIFIRLAIRSNIRGIDYRETLFVSIVQLYFSRNTGRVFPLDLILNIMIPLLDNWLLVRLGRDLTRSCFSKTFLAIKFVMLLIVRRAEAYL